MTARELSPQTSSEPVPTGKMHNGTDAGLNGWFNTDPTYFTDYQQRFRIPLVQKHTTLINEVILTGESEPFAIVATGEGRIHIPTGIDLERIADSAQPPGM